MKTMTMKAPDRHSRESGNPVHKVLDPRLRGGDVLRILVVCLLTSALFVRSSFVVASTSIGSLTLTHVKARIFTPNADGINDKVRFEFDNPEMLPIGGTVYDLNGARVSDLSPGASDPTAVLLWDGKDGSGQVVAGGIYLYQISFEGKVATGTVVVAR
jgi:hypothetical protein